MEAKFVLVTGKTGNRAEEEEFKITEDELSAYTIIPLKPGYRVQLWCSHLQLTAEFKDEEEFEELRDFLSNYPHKDRLTQMKERRNKKKH